MLITLVPGRHNLDRRLIIKIDSDAYHCSMSMSLFAAKLYIPPPRHKIVSRLGA
jgi:hypothetical protein